MRVKNSSPITMEPSLVYISGLTIIVMGAWLGSCALSFWWGYKVRDRS